MEDKGNQIDLIFTEEVQDPTTSVVKEEVSEAAEEESQDEDTNETLPEDSSKTEQKDTEDGLVQLKRFTEENEDLNTATKTLRGILGGDFLTAKFVRSQFWLIVLIFGCFFAHISLRYINQKELVEIDHLKKQLDDARFNTLTRFSELTAKSRQTYIEEFLKQHNDSTLQTATQPPFIIHLNGDDSKLTEMDSIRMAAEHITTSVEEGTVE